LDVLKPPSVRTTTTTGTRTPLPAGTTHVSDVADSRSKLAQAATPTDTCSAAARLRPVTVMSVPPAAPPFDGVTRSTVGQSASTQPPAASSASSSLASARDGT
jgi:hypothetical protein